MLRKFICTSKIHSDQSISYLSMEEKKKGLNKQKIQRHSLIIHKQSMIAMKI